MKRIARYIFQPRLNLFDVVVLSPIGILGGWWLLLIIPAVVISTTVENRLFDQSQ